jgi:predicted Fe-S protein YdhL (DUF1289 family)
VRPYPPRLFTTEEWAAMTDDEREAVWEKRRREVEAAREEHNARRALDDALTVERFGRAR